MTHAYLGLVLLDVAFLAVGTSLLFGLGLLRFRRAHLRLLGLALFLGWAASAACVGLAISLGIDAGLEEFAVQSVVLVGLGLGLSRLFPALEERSAPRSGGALGRVFAIVGAALLVISVGAALVTAWRSGADSSWDVWAFWLPKAKAIYYFHGLSTGLSGFSTYANSGYPPAAPALAATTFHLMGGVHATVLPFQQALLTTAFVGSVVVLLRRQVPPWILYPLLAMLSLAPEFWNRMASVLPDQSIGYLLALAMIASVLWLEERHAAWLGVGVVLLGAATLIKVEGFMLGLALAAAVTVVGFVTRHDYRGVVLFLGPVAIAPWDLWLSHHHQSLSSGVYSWSNLLDPHYLASRFGRLTYASRHLVDLIFALGDWRIVVPLALLVAVAAARTRPEVTVLLFAWLLLAFAGLAAVYWIGTPEIHWYVATSAQRVVGTLPIVAGTLAPLLLTLALAPAGDELSTRRDVQTQPAPSSPGS